MSSDLATVARGNPEPLPKEVRDIMKGLFGEIVPMSEEMQLKFIVELANLAKGIAPTPPAPLVDLPHWLLYLVSQLPEDALGQPVIHFSVPTIHVPTSTYMFFRTECKKQGVGQKFKLNVGYGNQGKTDIYNILWNSLTQSQKDNWTDVFMMARDQSSRLIALGYCVGAPSANQKQKESRKRRGGSIF